MGARKTAIVIPAFRESKHIERVIRSIQKSFEASSVPTPSVSVIVVVNRPMGSPDEYLLEGHTCIEILESLRTQVSFSLRIIDRLIPGLKSGVGEARKIGLDFAAKTCLEHNSDILVNLDADCTVSENYLSVLQSKKLRGSAFHLRFEHDSSGAEDPKPVQIYNAYLHYTKNQLERVGSPFAFFTVGSCIGTSRREYLASGGMPAKPATEDFAFLNKLRKRGPVEYWPEACVYPAPRFSRRVFLGTGHFLSMFRENPKDAFACLHLPSPRAFDALGDLLHKLRLAYDPKFSLEASIHHPVVREFLIAGKFFDAVRMARENSASQESFEKRLLYVFDGLQTYRLLRKLSQNEKPPTEDDFWGWVSDIIDRERDLTFASCDRAQVLSPSQHMP